MSKNPRRIVIADYEAAEREENTVILDLGDAGEITIDPPLFWGRHFKSADEIAAMPMERFIRTIIGEEQVELWLSTGRTIAELDKVFTHAQGMATGESDASSRG